MKKMIINVATCEADITELCNAYGLHFNSRNQLALAERFQGDPLQALIVADTKEDEAGWFINVIIMNHDTGTVHQWESPEGCVEFDICIGEVARLATATLGELVAVLARYTVIC